MLFMEKSQEQRMTEFLSAENWRDDDKPELVGLLREAFSGNVIGGERGLEEQIEALMTAIHAHQLALIQVAKALDELSQDK